MWRPMDRDAWAEAYNVEPEIAEAIFAVAANAGDAADMARDCNPYDAPFIVMAAQVINNRSYRFCGINWPPMPHETAARAKIRRDLAAAVHVLQDTPSEDELNTIIRNLVEAEHCLRFLRLKAAA